MNELLLDLNYDMDVDIIFKALEKFVKDIAQIEHNFDKICFLLPQSIYQPDRPGYTTDGSLTGPDELKNAFYYGLYNNFINYIKEECKKRER